MLLNVLTLSCAKQTVTVKVNYVPLLASRSKLNSNVSCSKAFQGQLAINGILQSSENIPYSIYSLNTTFQLLKCKCF